jgi:hypothetical protein
MGLGNMNFVSRSIRTITIILFISSIFLNVGMLASTFIAATVSGIFSSLTGFDSALERTAKSREQSAPKKQRIAAKKFSNRIRLRAVNGAARDLGAMFGEAIPYLGVIAIVGATTWDLKDACDTLKDIKELESAFGSASGVEEDLTTVCGQAVPTKGEVWASVRSSPERAWVMAKEQMPALPDPSQTSVWLTLPDWLKW